MNGYHPLRSIHSFFIYLYTFHILVNVFFKLPIAD
jgi:hypothetical protein